MAWQEKVLSGKCYLIFNRHEERAYARPSLWSSPDDSEEVDYEEAKAFVQSESLVLDDYYSSYLLSVYGIPGRCS